MLRPIKIAHVTLHGNVSEKTRKIVEREFNRRLKRDERFMEDITRRVSESVLLFGQ